MPGRSAEAGPGPTQPFAPAGPAGGKGRVSGQRGARSSVIWRRAVHARDSEQRWLSWLVTAGPEVKRAECCFSCSCCFAYHIRRQLLVPHPAPAHSDRSAALKKKTLPRQPRRVCRCLVRVQPAQLLPPPCQPQLQTVLLRLAPAHLVTWVRAPLGWLTVCSPRFPTRVQLSLCRRTSLQL